MGSLRQRWPFLWSSFRPLRFIQGGQFLSVPHAPAN
jgi:hypothetical protein